MRIISGTERGRRLTEISGKEIRPTPDRVREALFSALTSRLGSLQEKKVLELFAGSGAQSLEALSRGATAAWIVDSSPSAIRIIEENVRRCRCQNRARVIKGDALRSLDRFAGETRFDLILLDPPYHGQLIPPVLERIDTLQLLTDDGIICAETSREEELQDVGSLNLLDSRCYGSTRVHLYSHATEAHEE